MDQDMNWVAGRGNMEKVPELAEAAAGRLYYRGGSRQEDVSLEKVASMVEDLASVHDVFVSVSNSGPEQTFHSDDFLPTGPEASLSYIEARSEVIAAYYALKLEIEGALLDPRILTLRWAGPGDIEGTENSDADDFWTLTSALKGDASDDELWTQFVSEQPPTKAAVAEARAFVQDFSRSISGYWSDEEVVDVLMTRNYSVRPAIEIVGGNLDGEPRVDGRLTLIVDPWVPADVVTATYKSLQQIVFGQRSRALSHRNLTMSRFVLLRLRDAWFKISNTGPESKGTLPVGSAMWRVLTAEWNRNHPDDAYDGASFFRKDVLRTLGQVTRSLGEIGSK